MKISEKHPFRWGLLAFPLFVTAMIAAGILLWDPLTEIFRNPQRTRAWVDSTGPAAPLIFVALQTLQVVIFIIPGEIVQIGGGYVFGFWGATLLSSLGILAGSLVNFYVGRLLGKPFVEKIIRKETLARLEKSTTSGRAAAGFFLLYVIPGIPKDALSYVAGMSRISPPLFIAISGLGRLPGILGSAFMGSSAYKQQYGAALVVLSIASCLFFAGLIYKEKLLDKLHRSPHRRTRDPGNQESNPPAP